jgi:hypothetical protein
MADDVRRNASPDLVAHVDFEWIRGLVMRAIFCPVTGESLDVRTCHVFRDEDGDPVAVIAPGAYARLDADRLAVITAAGWTLDTRA